MPIVFRANEAKYKSEATGEYVGFNVIGEVTTDELVAEINEAGETQVDNVEAVGATQVSAVNTAGATQLNTVNTAGETQLNAVNTAGATQLNAVNTAGTTQVGNVNTAGTTQVNAVNQEGTTQVGLVNAEGATQVQAVEDKGAEVLESIPDDYEEKMDQVNDYLENLVVVSDTQPESESNKLWFEDQAEEEIEVPLYTEFEDVADAVDDLKNSLNLTTTYKTVSGDVATFDDGADNRRIRKIVGTIEPVQDLHGYDAPWPSGGGKNVFLSHAVSYSESGVTFTANSDGTVTVNGTATADIIFTISEKLASSPGDGTYCHLSDMGIVAGNSYILNGCPSEGNTGGYRLHLLVYGSGSEPSDNGTGSSAFTFSETDVTEKWYRLAIRIYNGAVCNNLVFKPMIRLASITDATYAPYSNECPISGWSCAVLTRTGKNLIPTTEDGYTIRTVNGTSLRTVAIEAKQGESFVYSRSNVLPLAFSAYWCDALGASVTATNIADLTGRVSYTITNTDGHKYLLLTYPRPNNIAFIAQREGQLEIGSVKTAYEAYKPIRTLPINWQSSAGTIYGGTVTLNEDGSADVVADCANYHILPSDWSYQASVNSWYVTRVSLSPPYLESASGNSGFYGICDNYPFAQYAAMVNTPLPHHIAVRNDNVKAIYCRTDGTGDTRPVETNVVLKVAEPVTYHFDNVGSLHSFLGANNVWIDSGSITELVYNAGSNVALTEDVNDPTTGLATKAPAIVNTVSGNVVSISDGAEGMPVKKLVGTIEPVQDLHGYANPWPAGSGNNVWDEEWELGSVNTTDGVKTSSTTIIRSKNNIPVVSGRQYCIVDTLSEGIYVLFYDENDDVVQYVKESGDTVSVSSSGASLPANTSRLVTAPQNAVYCLFRIQLTTYTSGIAINYPASVTTYSPYSNICPISGFEGVNIEQRRNIFDQDTIYETYKQEDGSFITTGLKFITSRMQIPDRLVGTELTFSAYLKIPSGSTITNPRVCANVNGQNINGNYVSSSDYTRSVVTFTPTSTSDYVELTYGTSGGQNMQAKDIQLEVGSAATKYKPYAANSLRINWQDTAGIIYGGMFTLNEDGSCDVVATHAEADLGSLTWTLQEGGYSGAFFQSKHGELPLPEGVQGIKYSMFCENYKTVQTKAFHEVANENYSILGRSTFKSICIVDKRFTTLEDFRAAISGTKVVYPLETPQTYHFDNAGQLRTFLGTNHIWLDTGSITKLDYSVDTGSALSVKQDKTKFVTLSGTAVNITAEDNTMYLCGELAELTFTAPATGITAIRFTSGTTPTVVSFSGVAVWLNGFDPTSIEASTTYEINVLDGIGVAAWT